MKRYVLLVTLALGLVAVLAFTAAPALASDDCGCTTCRSPGYWMNHPDAWPSCGIVIGCKWYSVCKAIEIMKMPVAGDKTLTMFPAVAAANLNLLNGCKASPCMLKTIWDANIWLCTHPPKSCVKAKTCAWQDSGGCLYLQLDAWNNGH